MRNIEMKWERHGKLLMLVCNGWNRGVVFMEGSGYVAVGIFGERLEEFHDTVKRRIMRRLESAYDAAFTVTARGQ